MNGLAGERVRFSLCLSKLEIYADSKGYGLARDEGRVLRNRKGYVADQHHNIIDFAIHNYVDRIHSHNSLHYQGLAQDYILYIDNVWITKDHLAWRDLAGFWKNLNPKCTWGGDFKTGSVGDFNHFSWGEGQ